MTNDSAAHDTLSPTTPHIISVSPTDYGPDPLAPDVNTSNTSSEKTTSSAPPRVTPATGNGSGSGPGPGSGSGSGSGGGGGAPASAARKPKGEPSLWTDFLRGRPTPARQAAQLQRLRSKSAVAARRSNDVAAVQEALRRAMRESAVRRVQPPGGVRDRVRAWQKASANATGGLVPQAEDVTSEPTEVAFQTDAPSVTEEDRVRIKMRMRRKSPRRRRTRRRNSGSKEEEGRPEEQTGTREEGEVALGAEQDSEDTEAGGHISAELPQPPKPARPAPKKRIVSDEHWKRKRTPKTGSSPRQVQNKGSQEGNPRPIPKDFLQRTHNPSVQSKIRDWATRVQVETADQTSPRVTHYQHKKTGETVTVEEDASSTAPPAPKPVGSRNRGSTPQSSPSVPFDDGIRVRPLNLKPKKQTASNDADDDGIRVRPLETTGLSDNGARIKAMHVGADGYCYADDGIRVRPSREIPSDGIKARPTPGRKPSVEEGRVRVPSHQTTQSANSLQTEDDLSFPSRPRTEFKTSPKRRRSSRRKNRRSPSPVAQEESPSPTTVTQTQTDSSSASETAVKTEEKTTPKRWRSSQRKNRRSPSPVTQEEPPSPITVTQTQTDSSSATETEVKTEEKTTPRKRRSYRRRSRRASSPAQQDLSPTTATSAQTDEDSISGTETELKTEDRTPPKRNRSSRRRSRRSPLQQKRETNPITLPRAQAGRASHHADRSDSDSSSYRRDGSGDDSERPITILGNKSLADIPFGYSAFSVLDLPSGANGRHKLNGNSGQKPKAHRSPTFKAVPNVIKKVVSGAKEIIHDRVDPHKPVVNQPPSIETWLNQTVDPDPFVDSPAKKKSVETQWAEEDRKRSTTAHKKEQNQGTAPGRADTTATPAPISPASRVHTPGSRGSRGSESREKPSHAAQDPSSNNVDATTTREERPARNTPSPGLQRRQATRVSSSPLKVSTKRSFRDAIKDAFRGESAHKLAPLVYPSYETEAISESEQSDEEWDPKRERRRYSLGSDERSRSRSHSPDTLSELASSRDSSLTDTPAAAAAAAQRRRPPPPTNGVHELSTIVSEESSASLLESETVSVLSHTTLTQATALSRRSSHASTRQRSQRSQRSGLKRRLTKHSDLVSVLSLPDKEQAAASGRSRSTRSSRSLHRRPSKVMDQSKVDDLLDEFADDEYIYQRELKTLVDGVVPVLLTQVVNDNGRSGGLFGPSKTSSRRRAESMAKSVVSMGVALEKMRNCHRQVPLNDIRRLMEWLETVSAVYDNYLDVWRLGFQNIIVNLAPAAGRPEDQDSLLNALPRNADGDVLGENGERVDVAQLLKKPLVRVRWMTKFLRAAVPFVATKDADGLLVRYETLQDKVRKRHREEVARATDEDASSSDTTRARDLRNLAPLRHVVINRHRQVAAKDSFSLDLAHSSGQRLECQVELIHRDNIAIPADMGDILIRDITSSTNSWLLFPPVPKQHISARKGDDKHTMVVMVSGSHNDREWYELLKLSVDDEDQILDWLDILGTEPVPPAYPMTHSAKRRASTSIYSDEYDVPVGERRKDLSGSFTPSPPQTPSTGPHRRHASVASSGASPSARSDDSSSSDKTATQEAYKRPQSLSGSPYPLPLSPRDQNTPKAKRSSPNSTPFREDGAPPPPIHRSLKSLSPRGVGPKSPTSLSPPPDLGPSPRVKRRTSSPLKHEYHPSDVSDESSISASDETDSESSSTSSNDELEEEQVPDTIPGYSIKDSEVASAQDESRGSELPRAESVLSEDSITPSISASQIGAHGVPFSRQLHTTASRPGPERCEQRFLASISFWSNRKGKWKDIRTDLLSVTVLPGMIEVRELEESPSKSGSPGHSPYDEEVGIDESQKDADRRSNKPLLGLELTPVIMIRSSTAIDLEVRSRASEHWSRLHVDSAMYRFRTSTAAESKELYTAVHRSRLNNAKFMQLMEEARVRSFGQGGTDQQGRGYFGGDQSQGEDGESSSAWGRSHGSGSGWFGRRNSYRASTRAPPSQSQGSSASGISASSFLGRLMGNSVSSGNEASFNIDRSTVGKQSRSGSAAALSSADGLCSTGPSAADLGSYSNRNSAYGYISSGSSPTSTPPRSVSISLSGSGQSRWSQNLSQGFQKPFSPDRPLQIRCHLNASGNKWADKGDCVLAIGRPPPGTRQELSLYHGMEKRIIVSHMTKKARLPSFGGLMGASSSKGQQPDRPLVLLDAVLGSKCFSLLGTKGIMCSVWENLRNEEGTVGLAPATGAVAGRVTKWCFECRTTEQASWIMGMVTSEVPEVFS